MILKEIFLFGFISFAAIALINLVGKFLTSLFIGFSKDKPYYNFFAETVVGLVAIITLYSCWCTMFMTVHTGFGILLFFLFLSNNNPVNYLKEVKLRIAQFQSGIYFHVLLLTLIVSFLNVIYPLSEGIENDVLFYVKIAEDIARSGRENFFYEYNGFVNEFNGTTPYHYFELWFGSILFKIFGTFLTNIIIFKYICYSVLKTLAILGLIMLIENFKRISLIDILIITVLSTFNLLYVTEFRENSWILYHDMWLRPNIAVYVIFLALFFNSLLEHNYKNAVLFALFLPIVSIVTAPAVFLGMCIFMIYLFASQKLQAKYFLIPAISVFILAAFIALFYQITSVDSKTLSTDNRSLIEMLEYSFSIINAIVFFVFSLSLRTMLMLLAPCVLCILFLENWKELIAHNALIIISALILAFAGIFAFQVFPFIDNTYQFPYIGYSACLMVALILFYQLIIHIKLHSRNNIISYVFLVSFVVLNILHISTHLDMDLSASTITERDLRRKGLDMNYIQRVENYLAFSNERMAGFILDEQDIAELYPGRRHSLTYQLGSYLAYIKSNFYLVALTSPDVLYNDDFKNSAFYQKAYEFNSLTPFYKNYSFDNYTKDLKDYILKNNIHCLIVSEKFQLGQLSGFNVKEVYKDLGTGSKFIILE